jgi:hypothetical protein
MEAARSWSGSRQWGRWMKSVGLLLMPIALYFVPVGWLNEQHSVCVFKNIFGHDCYGCGMMRAIISAIQCDFHAAYDYNKAVIIVFPLLVYIWITALIKLHRSKR